MNFLSRANGRRFLTLWMALLMVVSAAPRIPAWNVIDTPVFRPGDSLTTGIEPVAVAVADFNSDGRADIATANRGSNDVSVFLGGVARRVLLC